MKEKHTYYLVIKVSVHMEGNDLDNQRQEIADQIGSELDYEVKFDDTIETDFGEAKAKIVGTEVLGLLDECPI